MKEYTLLGISITCEVFGTTMLKMSDGFQVLLPSVGVVLGYALSFYCLSMCLKKIPLSLAYAIWSGIGTAITTLIGVLIWGDAFNSLTLSGIVFIISGVVLLNSSNGTKTAKEPSH